jgi:asparagine synthase (glutamine-hydrolysing)
MNALIGYWGHGKRDEWEAPLRRVLAQVSSRPQSFQHTFDQAGIVTGLATWGKFVRAQSDDKTLRAALAASGLPDEADVQLVVRQESLTLRRDAFGRVTLYWMQQPRVVWFATQLQLLLPLLEAPTISTAGLYGYACFSYVPTPLTPLKSVFAVAAGMTGKLQFSRSTPPSLEIHWVKQADEWQEGASQLRGEQKCYQQLQKLLTKAMQKQLADKPPEPVGVFLSGGLDSSVTAALLAQAGVKVRAYTLDFGAYGVSEVPQAERVAAYLQLPLTKVDATPKHIQQALTATAQALDMPFGDGVTAPLYLLHQAARQDCAVLFNGEGGDQLFGGWTNKPLLAADVYQQVHPAGNEFSQDYLRTFHRLHGHEADVFQAAVREELQSLDPLNWLGDALESLFGLHRLRRANLLLKGAQNIQPRASNLALAHDLAVRTPFCDRELAAWTFQVASDLFLRESHEKYLLKRAVELWLPPDIVWREKRGMGVPLTQWCLGPLWREIGAWLQPAVLRAEGVWQEDLALRVATGNLSGQIQGRRIGEILWLLLQWQVWRKTVLQVEFPRASLQPFLLPPKFWQWWLRERN